MVKRRRKAKSKSKIKDKAPATPKIKNMDTAVLDAVNKIKEIEFIQGEIEQNKLAGHRRMERHMEKVNRGTR